MYLKYKVNKFQVKTKTELPIYPTSSSSDQGRKESKSMSSDPLPIPSISIAAAELVALEAMAVGLALAYSAFLVSSYGEKKSLSPMKLSQVNFSPFLFTATNLGRAAFTFPSLLYQQV